MWIVICNNNDIVGWSKISAIRFKRKMDAEHAGFQNQATENRLTWSHFVYPEGKLLSWCILQKEHLLNLEDALDLIEEPSGLHHS